MPTLLEIAEHADVPVEGAVRALMGESVNSDVAERVRRAVSELGAPHANIVEAMSILDTDPKPVRGAVVNGEPNARRATDHAPQVMADTVERTREGLLEAFAQAAADPETTLPHGVSSVVYEALRVEVEPVSQRIGQMGALVEELTRVVRQVGDEVGVERRERLEDVKLITELLVTSWRNVNNRLGRIERKLERMERTDRRASSYLP